MKKYFVVRKLPFDVDMVLLMMRLFVGYAFILHGWGKIQNPMAWMGADSAIPGIFQALAALSEFGGGIALILGLVTRLASLGLAITMFVAAYFHLVMMGDPAVNLTGKGSAEPALVYLLISVLFLIAGPGRISIDKQVFGSK